MPWQAQATAPEIKFSGVWNQSTQTGLEETFRKTWSEWESVYGARANGLSSVNVSRARVGGGKSRGNQIVLDIRLSPSDLHSIGLHELAHLFFESRCGEQAASYPVIAEIFAQKASGDYQRIQSQSKKFIFQTEAVKWMKTHAWKPDTHHHPDFQKALARILSHPSSSNVDFRRILTNCSNGKATLRTAQKDWIHRVLAPDAPPTTAIDFLMIDGHSKQVLSQIGFIETPFPVGSTLKPVLVAALPELMTSKVSGHGLEWSCPHQGPPRRWEWTEALAKSCNGFFVAHEAQSTDWKSWTKLMKTAGVKDLPLKISAAIGLVEGYSLDLRQILTVYEWALRSRPEIHDALRLTASDGTMSRMKDSEWFISRKIALKSGSLRTLDGKPIHSWIVAVGPSSEMGKPSFYAVIHSAGRSTHSLLSLLREKIEKRMTRDLVPAKVQILGLVPGSSIRFECPRSAFIVPSKNGPYEFSEKYIEGKTAECLGSPVTAVFPAKNSFAASREYWGAIEFDPRGLPSIDGVADPKAGRARRGSPFVLVTSERHYVANVLESEAANSPLETLKALSLAVRNNLRFNRHEGRPPCDTTHCQVFGHAAGVSKSLKNKIQAALDETAGTELVWPGKPEWMHFSLGGSAEWRVKVSEAKVAQATGVLNVSQLISRKVECEKLRSSLKLRSCPNEAKKTKDGWVFQGNGDGHGLGLDVIKANFMAGSGENYLSIMKRFFPGVGVREY